MSDAKITALTEDTAPAPTDLVATVEDPSGSAVTKKCTITNLNEICVVKAVQSSASNSWTGSGTTNTDHLATAVYLQVGTNTASGAADKTITFPNAYSIAPNCVATTAGASGANAWTEIISISTTQLTIRQITDAGATASEKYNWWAIGPQ